MRRILQNFGKVRIAEAAVGFTSNAVNSSISIALLREPSKITDPPNVHVVTGVPGLIITAAF
jgi:hypothetical protein